MLQLRLPNRTQAMLIATLTLLVAALALCVDRAHNGDVYLQLFTGRFITHNGFVSHDPFPTIAQGRPWLNQQWLSEVIFYRTSQLFGITGLTVIYAVLITAPLTALLWACRRKGTVMALIAAVFYFPGLLAIIHPRAAGFTVVAFSALVLLVIAATRTDRRPTWPLAAIAVLFLLWANLHGGFVAGLLLLTTVAAGMAIDSLRRTPDRLPSQRIALIGAVVVVAGAIVSFATPLGASIWTYVLSFRNPGISFGTQEWRPAVDMWTAVLYLTAAAGCSLWMWARTPAPRKIAPLLVTAVFIAFAAYSVRNIVFIGPVIAFQIAWSAPKFSPFRARIPIAVTGVAAVGAVLVWALLGPAQVPTSLSPRAVDYALAHPPSEGRIATYAGVGSYMLWRAPKTRVVLNGWLEHYTPEQLQDTYGILRGHPGTAARARRLDVGAVIAHLPFGIKVLEENGFVPVYEGPDGTYLVRRDLLPGAARS